jgi:hypothetical protein
MPGKRLVQFEKVPHTPEIQGRIGQQLKAQYDVAEPIPDRLAELLKQLAQLELLKELRAVMAPERLGGWIVMPDARQKLISLLDYVEQVVRLDERVAFRLSEYRLPDSSVFAVDK